MVPDVVDAATVLDKEQLKAVTRISEVSIEKSPKGNDMLAWVAFLHDWDPEHTRSLVVDRKLRVVGYGLTVGM